MSKIHQNEISGLELSIRKAIPEDYDDLTAILRAWRKDMLRWRVPKSQNRKWWKLLHDKECSETWVCSYNGQIVGFVLIVFNRLEYEYVWMRNHITPMMFPYVFVSCPNLFIKVTIEKIKVFYAKIIRKMFGVSSNNEQTTLNMKIKQLFKNNMPWIGPICVIPNMQGEGIASEMLQFSMKRISDLGYKEANAYIETDNIKSKKLFSKFGFEKIERVSEFDFYKKILRNQ